MTLCRNMNRIIHFAQGLRRKKSLQHIALIAVVTFIAFLPSLNNGFTNWDDNEYLTDNPAVRTLSVNSLARFFGSMQHGNYQPLTLLSFAIEHTFFKLQPVVYHLDNLLLHLGNCMLVYILVLLLCGSRPAALLTGLLFGIHPLHVESVAWVAERKDVLYGFFFLGSLVAYQYFLCRGRKRYYWIAFALFILCLLPKVQGVTLPLLLVVLDYRHRGNISRPDIMNKMPFLAAAILFLAINVYGMVRGKEIQVAVGSGLPWRYGMNIAFCYTFYLFKIFVPAKLSCLYPDPLKAKDALFYVYLISPVVTAALVAVCAGAIKTSKDLFWGTSFYAITLLPVVQILPAGNALVADRYAYIASTGIFYLAARWLTKERPVPSRLKKLWRPLKLLAVGSILVALSLATALRCRVWKDSESLWRDAISKYPHVLFIAYNNLGEALVKEGKKEEAMACFRESLRINPRHAKAYHNLGVVWSDWGETGQAIACYREAIRLDPHYANAYVGLGNALDRQGKSGEAIACYREAIRKMPHYAPAYLNLGIALRGLGKADEEIACYREAVRIDPLYDDAYVSLGNAFSVQGKPDSAIACYREAIRINPRHVAAHINLGSALSDRGITDTAIACYQEALRINPAHADAWYNLGLALLGQGKADEAVSCLRKSVRLNPNDEMARKSLEKIEQAMNALSGK